MHLWGIIWVWWPSFTAVINRQRLWHLLEYTIAPLVMPPLGIFVTFLDVPAFCNSNRLQYCLLNLFLSGRSMLVPISKLKHLLPLKRNALVFIASVLHLLWNVCWEKAQCQIFASPSSHQMPSISPSCHIHLIPHTHLPTNPLVFPSYWSCATIFIVPSSHMPVCQSCFWPLRSSHYPNLFPAVIRNFTCLSLKLLSCCFQPGLCQHLLLHPVLRAHWMWHTPVTESGKTFSITHDASCYTVGLCRVVFQISFHVRRI